MARETQAEKKAREEAEAKAAADKAAREEEARLAKEAAQKAANDSGDQNPDESANGPENGDQEAETRNPDPINDPVGGEIIDSSDEDDNQGLYAKSPMRQEPERDDSKVQAPDGLIIEPGEEVVFDGTVIGNYIRVDRDVFQKAYPFRAKRPTYILKYRKGALVPANSVVRKGDTFGTESNED